jgi:type II restriction/modification system DNA methylase subunit YeeA
LNPFAVELARVTLMIARKIAIDNFGILDQPALPLDSLDQNIVCADALFTDWPKADAIVGNPPFLGGKNLRLNLGDAYTDKLFNHFPEVKDSVDFCSYWFRLAHNQLAENGRAGLVATNSISQGKSRIASLDYLAQNGGVIHDAISTQVWSGEAKVHVSITNWCRSTPTYFYLDNEEVTCINSSLTAETDVSQSVRLSTNFNYCFQGLIPVGKGFYISPATAEAWIESHPSNTPVLRKSCSAGDLTDVPNGTPSRWIIDFNDLGIEDASEYVLPFHHVKSTVKPERDRNRRDVTKLDSAKFFRY